MTFRPIADTLSDADFAKAMKATKPALSLTEPEFNAAVRTRAWRNS